MQRARAKLAAASAAVILGVAGVAAAFMRPGVRVVDPLTAAGWAMGPVTVTPRDGTPGRYVLAGEVTNTGDRIASGRFTLLAVEDDGTRRVVAHGVAEGVLPTETRSVEFRGVEGAALRGGPYVVMVDR